MFTILPAKEQNVKLQNNKNFGTQRMSKNIFLQDLFSEKISVRGHQKPHNQLLEITFSQNVFKMVKMGTLF